MLGESLSFSCEFPEFCYPRAMKYAFDGYVLDTALGELHRDGEAQSVEPRAFALLCFLVENRDRMVTKDDLVEAIWDGRVVSDAAISTVVKSARKALDDDGKTQRRIKTLHGRGFRFVTDGVEVTGRSTGAGADASPLREIAGDVAPGPGTPRPVNPFQGPTADPIGQGPTVAVLPFSAIGSLDAYSAITDAVPSELISSLSRLRWLKVVARGSSFRFREAHPDLEQVRLALGANYCLLGDVEVFAPNLAISLELSDTRSGRVIWADRLTGPIEDVHRIRAEIVALVTSAMELHIPLNEVDLARLKAPESLDAWSSYHLGLQHMYRFTKDDNLKAETYLARAVELDPNFARAYAARSFTSFQSAFLRYGLDRGVDIDNAQDFAERAMALDPLDPFGNFNFGRVHWLREEPEAGQAWIERAISLSPSFAQGYYAHAWADAMAGKSETALENIDKAIALSPLDPFLYAMQSAKGIAMVQGNDHKAAAYWAEQGARQPGAHHLIAAVSAAINKVAGEEEKAEYWAKSALSRRPDTSVAQFFNAFPFEDLAFRAVLTKALLSLGFAKD